MRGLAALVLTLCLLVSGCGGDDPQPAPSPTKSPSPSETTPPPPEMPEAASPRSRSGALAFAEHYVDLVNHAQRTGDTGPLADIETPEASSCKESHASVERIYSTGGKIEGGDWSIDAISATKNPATRGYLVTMTVTFGPQTVTWPDNKPEQTFKGGRLPINLQLKRMGSAWKASACTRGA